MAWLAAAFLTLAFLASALPRRLYAWRVGLLIACFYGLGSLPMVRFGPLAGPALCYALVVLCGAVFAGIRTAMALLLFTTLSFVGAGLLVSQGITPPLASGPWAYDAVAAWVRSVTVFACLTGMMATTVWMVLRRIGYGRPR